MLPDVPDVENIALSYLSGEAKEVSQDTDSENRPALLSGSEFERLLWEGVDDMLAGRDIMQPDVISDVLQPEGSDDSVSAEEYGGGSVPANDGQLTDAASLFEKIDLLDKE